MDDRDRRRPDVTTVEVVGGQPPLTIGLQEHDPGWAEAYLVHRRRILAAVGDAALAVPADRDLYARTKRELMTRRWESMDAYAEAKTAVIQGILARARAARATRGA